SELAMPDLDLIKRVEQGYGTGAGGQSLCPPVQAGAGFGSRLCKDGKLAHRRDFPELKSGARIKARSGHVIDSMAIICYVAVQITCEASERISGTMRSFQRLAA